MLIAGARSHEAVDPLDLTETDCLIRKRLGAIVASSSPVGLRVRRTWRFCGARSTPSFIGGDLPQRVAAHGRRPAYHVPPTATRGSRWQRISLVSAAFATSRFAADCHRLQPRG